MSSDGRNNGAGSPTDHTQRIPDNRPRPTPVWALLSAWLLGTEAWLRSHGGDALRFSIRGLWIAVSAVAAFLLVGPVVNPPLTLDDITDAASNATDTWIARDFDTSYTVTRDDDGRLQAEVVETITAFFPEDLNETGIQRVLATQYQGHDIDPTGLAVAIDGDPVELVARESSDRMTITLDTGERLRGDHVFEIRYHLQDLAYSTTDDTTGATVDLLEWDVFGPSWPQGFAGLTVSVSLPDDLADDLVRAPYGGVAWTLVSGADWLEAEEDSPAGQQVYEFSVDQNVPPHASAWFRMVFPAETFTMPPPSGLFLFQTFGPLIPLAILLLTLPFSLAARAVAWSDARGRAWFVAQDTPPADITVAQAAQIMRRARTRELALAVDRVRFGKRAKTDSLVAIWRAARRTGRVGDIVRARTGFALDRARRSQVKDGFRRIPHGFVRDWFIAAPLALTLVQFAIIRQLSHQATLAVIWWPPLFVLVSLVVSAVVLWIALSARPLTRKGALARQYLRGVDVFARRTNLVDRTTFTEPLLPYALVTADARPAGRRMAALAAEQIDDRSALRGWRTTDFLSWPRLGIYALSVLLVAGAITAVSIMSNPYDRVSTFDRYNFESRGTLYTLVETVDVTARISADDGSPRIDVTSRYGVEFDENSRIPPQFAVPLLNAVEAQSMGLAVTEVRVDGTTVPFTVTEQEDVSTVTTQMSDVRSGPAEVELVYSYDSPATAGAGSPVSGAEGQRVDRIRWAAILDGWERGWTYPSAPDPVSVSVRIDDSVSELALSSGWLREDPDTAQEARDWRDSSFAFGTLEDELGPSELLDPEDHGLLAETREAVDGGVVHGFETGEGEYGYPTRQTYSDLGVLLEFPANTWAGPDQDQRDAAQFARALPIILVVAPAVLAIALGIAAVIRARVRGSRQMAPGAVRDLFWWLAPAATLASSIVFIWASADMPASWPELPPMVWSAGLALLGAIACGVAVRPWRPTRKARTIPGTDAPRGRQ